MAVVWQYGWETEGLTTPPFDTVSGDVQIETTIVASGARSLKSNAVAAPAYLRKTLSSATLYVVQFRFRIPSSMPGGYSYSSGRLGGTGMNCFFRVSDTTARSLHVRLTDGFTNGDSPAFTYTANTWHLLSARLNVSANPWVCDWSIDGAAQTQASFASAATDITLAEIGANAGAAGLVEYFDDWALGNASGDYPMNVSVSSPLVTSLPGYRRHSRMTSW